MYSVSLLEILFIQSYQAISSLKNHIDRKVNLNENLQKF